jgi:putative ABC transport system permease protein
MIRNLWNIAIRNLIRHKAYSLINIVGLAVGLACFVFIILWIHDELSYDTHNEYYETIYRAAIDFKSGEMEGRGITSTAPLAPAMMEEIPEILYAARFLASSTKLVEYREGNISFLEENIYWADSTLFNIFTLPVVTGDPADFLTRKNTIVLTRSVAEKYFGSTDPLGKMLNYDGGWEFEVVGVVEDVPYNSHWRFDMLTSMCSIKRASSEEWLSDNLQTYFRIRADADPDEVKQKINELFRHHANPLFQQFLGIDITDWEAEGNRYEYYLAPLKDIYLHNVSDDSIGKTGDIRYIYLFAAIGFFILLVACINFMNLTTARSAIRAREIGMRKVLGSSRRQLIYQFLFESILVCFVALLLAVLLIEFFMPMFNQLTDKSLAINYLHPATLPLFVLLLIVVGCLSGGYSALSLSSFDILTTLKGSLFRNKNKTWFRNALVLFQFTVSILVIVCTLVAGSQMHYIQHKKLGFNKEHCLVIDRVHTLGDKLDTFKAELLKHSTIQYASKTYAVPGTGTNGSMYHKPNTPMEEMYHFRIISGDFDYVKVLGLQMVQGRYFDPTIASDSSAIVINETAVRKLGLTNPIGYELHQADQPETHTIIGVVKDFHNMSFRNAIPSLMMVYPGLYWDHYMVVRFASGDTSEGLNHVKQVWREFSDNQPIQYFFLDNHFDNLHSNEMRTGHFFLIFAILAIGIACLGLFGLAAFTAQQKTKEIGVRKVLGATTQNIVLVLLRQFTRWVVLANIVAWPIAWYVMRSWLQNFVYRINLNLLYFIVAGCLTLAIALSTVFVLAWKAAGANPVKSLKYE